MYTRIQRWKIPRCQDRPDHTTDNVALNHSEELFRRAKRLMGTAHDAEDLVQDTFERAFRSMGRFKRGSNMRAWLFTIMNRRALDLSRLKVRLVLVGDQGVLESLAKPTPDDSDSPSWLDLDRPDVLAAVAALPPLFRQILELRNVARLPYREIARQLDIPINTAASRIWRARQLLRHEIVQRLSSSAHEGDQGETTPSPSEAGAS